MLVTVGTDHHRFDRLITWTEDWSNAHPSVRVVVQHGASRRPVALEAYERISHSALSDLIGHADVVVTHGGGGTITQTWIAGKVPIIVPRVRSLNEHVDDHQLAFSAKLAQMGSIVRVNDYAGFYQVLTDWVEEPSHRLQIDISRPTPTVVRVGELIEEVAGSRQRRARR